MISRNAKRALYRPHNNKWGTNMNSMIFIVAITSICAMALSRDLIPLRIHKDISISEMPISLVNRTAWLVPKMVETISSCLGTMPRILHNNPFINQTAAIQ